MRKATLRSKIEDAQWYHLRLIEDNEYRLHCLVRGEAKAELRNALKQKIRDLNLHLELYQPTPANEFVPGEGTRNKRELLHFKARRAVATKRLDISRFLADATERFLVIRTPSIYDASVCIPQYVATLTCFRGGRVISAHQSLSIAKSAATQVDFEWNGGDRNRIRNLDGCDVVITTDASCCAEDLRMEFIQEAKLVQILNKLGSEMEDDDSLRQRVCIVVNSADLARPNCAELLRVLQEDRSHWHHIKVIMTTPLQREAGSLFNNVQCIEIIPPKFPVTVVYREAEVCSENSFCHPDDRVVGLVVRAAIDVLKDRTLQDGDVVCFLRSREDTEHAARLFRRELQEFILSMPRMQRQDWAGVCAVSLFCHQSPVAHLRAVVDSIGDTDPHRRVFFATEAYDCASIRDIVCVIDSGLRYAVRYDPVRHLSRLEIARISSEEALRRLQLASTMPDGRCIRLYNESGAIEEHRREVETTASNQENLVSRFELIGHDPSVGRSYLQSLDGDESLSRMLSFAANRGQVLVGIDLVAVLLVADDFFESDTESSITITSGTGNSGDVVRMFNIFCESRTTTDGDMQNDRTIAKRSRRMETWCRSLGVSIRAIRMATEFSRCLRDLLGEFLQSTTSQPPDDSTLCRIIASGFASNVAVCKRFAHVNANPPEFIKVQSLEIGSLAPNSALMSSPLLSRLGPEPPVWIVYLSETCVGESIRFSFVTPIEEIWILEDSPQIAAATERNRLALPVRVCEWTLLSPEIFSALGNVAEDIEQRFACRVLVDSAKSTIMVTEYALHDDEALRAIIDTHLDRARELLRSHAFESVYKGTTRVVIGEGFQAQELLFGDDFASLSVHGLKRDGSMNLIQQICDTARSVAVSLTPQAFTLKPDPLAIMLDVQLSSKEVASHLLSTLRSSEDYKYFMVVPRTKEPTRFQCPEVRRMVSGGQIKISWATGPPLGCGTIHFATAFDANVFLRGFKRRSELSASVVSLVDSDTQFYTREVHQIPPMMTDGGQMLYDEAMIKRMGKEKTAIFEYCVHIQDGLPHHVDEVQLARLASPAKVLRCTVKRQPGDSNSTREQVNMILEMLESGVAKCPWDDPEVGRGGIIEAILGIDRAEARYGAISKSSILKTLQAYRQPIRVDLEYTCETLVDVDVFKWSQDKLSLVAAGLRQTSCVIREESDKQAVRLTFSSRNRKAIRAVLHSVDEIYACEEAVGGDYKVLFSRTGTAKFRAWLKLRPRRDAKVSRRPDFDAIWVYGEKSLRRHEFARLQELVETIHREAEELDRIVRVDTTKYLSLKRANSTEELFKRWFAVQPYVKNRVWHWEVVDGNGTLSLSGKSSCVQTVVDYLASRGLLVHDETHHSRTIKSMADCSLCFLPIDEPAIQFTVCGHSCCLECIRPGVTASTRLPLLCPAENCKWRLHVSDVLKINKETTRLVDAAVFDFVSRYPLECSVCPRPGCNQILSLKGAVRGRDGRCVYCGSCKVKYCVDCSAAHGWPVKAHRHIACEDYHAHLESQVRHIRDFILTLRCPRCKAAFLDFDGCLSVRCGSPSCEWFFCAACMSFTSDCSETCHQHVSLCVKNTRRGSYYATAEEIALMQRSWRNTRLQVYLESNVASPWARRTVAGYLEEALAEFGLTIPNHLLDTNLR